MKKLLGQKKIENLELFDAEYQIQSVVDDVINRRILSIEIIFISTSLTYSISIKGFTYIETWEDIDIENYVENYLNNL